MDSVTGNEDFAKQPNPIVTKEKMWKQSQTPVM